MKTQDFPANGAEPGRGALITDRIRLALPNLSHAHEQIARYVLRNAEQVTQLSAAQLAAKVGVSQPSVTRFCQALGLGSYQALLLALAGEAGQSHGASPMKPLADGLSPDDSLEQVAHMLTRLDIDAMELVARQLDFEAIEAAAQMVAAARHTDVYGVGASGLIAQELELRLFRLGVPIRAWVETHAAATSAALRSPEDVIVAISASGRTRETYEALVSGRERGAKTIALTSDPASPVALAADVHLTTIGTGTTYRTASFAARHGQLLLIDILYTRIAQLDHDRALDAVAATAHIVPNHRVREPRSTQRDAE
ncbi:MurR/RpiR family transcriptional regulator [Leucobacter sp. BZR 635]